MGQCAIIAGNIGSSFGICVAIIQDLMSVTGTYMKQITINILDNLLLDQIDCRGNLNSEILGKQTLTTSHYNIFNLTGNNSINIAISPHTQKRSWVSTLREVVFKTRNTTRAQTRDAHSLRRAWNSLCVELFSQLLPIVLSVMPDMSWQFHATRSSLCPQCC